MEDELSDERRESNESEDEFTNKSLFESEQVKEESEEKSSIFSLNTRSLGKISPRIIIRRRKRRNSIK